jgi:threonine/homoserine/homoserine lactone efflux protein
LLTALIIGAIAGFVLALVPGPVGISIIKTGILDGRRSGAFMAMGASLMDMIYVLITAFATSAVFQSFSDFSNNHQGLVLFFRISIIALFIILGFLNLKSSRSPFADISLNEKENKIITRFKKKGPFVVGMAMAITCVASPTFFPSITWVSLQARAWNLLETKSIDNIIFAIGFAAGNFLWLYTLIILVERFRQKFENSFFNRIKAFAGYTFLGFGALLGYRIFHLIKFPELLRVIFAF